MQRLATLLIFILMAVRANADHITGGELFYTLASVNGNEYKYNATLKLYMRCNSGRTFNDPTIISVFSRATGNRVADLTVGLSSRESISLTDPDPCISNPPTVCYEIGLYNFPLTLQGSAEGYVITGQVNYRVSGIANLTTGYSQVGATYTAEIPGNAEASNNSAKFTGSDLVIVCANNRFSYSFAAADADADELRYAFCSAYLNSSNPGGGGIFGGGNQAAVPLSPPYSPLPYGNNFYGEQPLGMQVDIDPHSGLITGIAPGPGIYVITVCVQEVRNGVVIATQRKDLQISITSCNIAAALLLPEYMVCGETSDLTVENLSESPLIRSYRWEITNTKNEVVFTSADPVLKHSFIDTGLYTVKLQINPGEACTDSATALARVYPGFLLAFDHRGICTAKPTQFIDNSTTQYGVVNGWRWDFDDRGQSAAIRNPSHTFSGVGNYQVSLIATNSKGCIDTLVQEIRIVTNPPLLLAFTDTLICPPDALTLVARGAGTYTWQPSAGMANPNTPTPTVSPTVTTTYYANLNDNGCLNRDSVTVRVTNRVNLVVMPDTTICLGDAVQLRASGNANLYTWTPAATMVQATTARPTATPTTTTVYRVTGTISQCRAEGQVRVTTVPYPIANAGTDTLICFGTTAQLNGTGNGTSLLWTPANSLSNAAIGNPVASPPGTTTYVLSAFNPLSGCPKPGTDTVVVMMLPKIIPMVTRDTAVVVGEKLPLQASGGSRYAWEPSLGLSDNSIANPVALYGESHNLIRYRVNIFNQAGCVDSAFVNIKVFETKPTVFVPTAFTPNADGKNDFLRPIAVGVRKIERFTVFNRYGQVVFTTTVNGYGWNGSVNGQPQASGTYVWLVQAIDYLGAPIQLKGSSTLIR